MTVHLYSKKFYKFLVSKDEENNKNRLYLFKDYPIDSLNGKFVISLQHPKYLRLFSVFESYIEYIKWILSIAGSARTCYEMIMGEFNQKPHFDIDIKTSDDTFANNVLQSLIDNIIIQIPDIVIDRDLLIYTSHGENKRSFHVVVNGWYHNNNLEAKQFYHDCIDGITNEEYKQHIDSAVYSIHQQYRLLWNHKLESDRCKILLETFKYKDVEYRHKYCIEPINEKHKLFLQCEESLVSHTAACKPLKSNLKLSDMTPIKYEDFNFSEATVKKVIERCTEMYKGVFKYDELKDGYLIVFKRLKPSMCDSCERIHEHENPYVILKSHIQGIVNVYFNCRRGKNILIFTVSDDSNDDNGQEEQTNDDDNDGRHRSDDSGSGGVDGTPKLTNNDREFLSNIRLPNRSDMKSLGMFGYNKLLNPTGNY